jgi:hypothetical protein
MKKPGFIDFLWSYLFILVQLAYLLVEPLIFTTVGLILQVSWQYYLVSIGGYYALTAVWELVAYLMANEGGKKLHSPFIRRVRQVKARFNADTKPVEEESKEEN